MKPCPVPSPPTCWWWVRLHRAVDGIACRTAQSGPEGRAGRRRTRRLGGIGSQRRLRRRQPDPRRRERKSALAQRDRHPRGDGHREPRRHAGRYHAAGTRRRLAAHRDAVGGDGAAPGDLVAGGRRRRRGPVPQRRTRCAPRLRSPTYLAGLFSPDSTAIVHPAKLAFELARACADAGVHIFEHTNVTAMDGASGPITFSAGGGRSHRRTGRAGHQRLPQPGRAQPAADHSGIRLCARNRATHRRTARPHRMGQPTGNRRLRQPVSLLQAVRRQSHRVGRLRRHLQLRPQGRSRPTRTGLPAIAFSPRTSSSPFLNSTTSGSAIAGRAPSTPTPGSVPTGGLPAADASPT